MAVILANTSLALRTRNAHPFERDDFGTPVAAPESEQSVGPLVFYPGYAKERRGEGDSGVEWNLRVDPALWPLEKHDQLQDPSAHVWAVSTAVLHEHATGLSDVDYIEVLALLEVPKVL